MEKGTPEKVLESKLKHILASVFLNGKPLHNERYVERIKRHISKDGLRKWAKKYYSDGLKTLGKSADKGDMINDAATYAKEIADLVGSTVLGKA